MSKIAIVTDTNSGITMNEADQLGVHIIAMPFTVNSTLYYEGVTLTQEEFYQHLERGSDISTSQPSPGEVMGLWDELLKTHDSILHIPMSSGLSGSLESARMLAVDYDGKVLVVDNKRISLTLRQAVIDALALREDGVSAKEIQDILEKEALEASIYLSVDTLKYLKKGGRITPAAAAIGNALNIKPVLQIQGGKLDTYRKVRGIKQAQKVLLEAVKQDVETRFSSNDVIINVTYSGDITQGIAWKEITQQYFPEYDIYECPLPLSICCHTGPGALGIVCIKK